MAGDAKYPGLPHYSILRKSPARNAGANADWMLSATDFAGNARIFDDVVDIGCYECWLLKPGFMIIVE